MADDPHGDTNVYEKLAKQKDPFWFTIRQQFTFTSLLTVLTVLGGWIISFLYQNTRIVVLETKVVVVEKVSGLTERVATLEADAKDHERRITKVEGDWYDAREWKPAPQPEPPQPPPLPKRKRR